MAQGGKTSATWEKGKPPPVQKPKGAKNKTTLMKERIGLANFNELGQYLQGEEMAARIKKELGNCEGKDFISAFKMMLEFFRPAMQKTELTGKDGEPLSIKVGYGDTED